IAQPLAVVVIGGLVSSTLLTLVIVPVLYRLAEGPGERKRLKEEAHRARLREERERAEAEKRSHRAAEARARQRGVGASAPASRGEHGTASMTAAPSSGPSADGASGRRRSLQ